MVQREAARKTQRPRCRAVRAVPELRPMSCRVMLRVLVSRQAAHGLKSSSLSLQPPSARNPPQPPPPIDPSVPSTGAPPFPFLLLCAISTLPAPRHAALLRYPGIEELGFCPPLFRDTQRHPWPASRTRVRSAAADPPGTCHLEPDARQH